MTTDSSGNAAARRLAHSREVEVCGGSMRRVAPIGPRHYAVSTVPVNLPIALKTSVTENEVGDAVAM